MGAPHTQPKRLAGQRRRRIQKKGSPEGMTSSATEGVGVKKGLVHVPAIEFPIIVERVLRVDGDTSSRIGSFDKEVWNHAGVRLVGQRVHNDGAVAAAVAQ